MPAEATDTTNVTLTSHTSGAVREGAPTANGQLHPAPEGERIAGDPPTSNTRLDVGASTRDPGKSDPRNEGPRQALALTDIKVGNLDGRGVQITYVYAAQANEYAIYHAGDVMVQFADDIGKAQAQKNLSFQ
jgi:hypothetical protein